MSCVAADYSDRLLGSMSKHAMYCSRPAINPHYMRTLDSRETTMTKHTHRALVTGSLGWGHSRTNPQSGSARCGQSQLASGPPAGPTGP